MKTTIIAALLVVVMGGLVLNAKFGQPVEVTNEKLDISTSTVEVVEETEEVDMIQAAKAELDRINKELDVEETRLLEERDKIDAKLEEIKNARTSF